MLTLLRNNVILPCIEIPDFFEINSKLFRLIRYTFYLERIVRPLNRKYAEYFKYCNTITYLVLQNLKKKKISVERSFNPAVGKMWHVDVLNPTRGI